MAIVRIQLRRDVAADWTSANPTLTAGEVGFETDTGKYKIGDGSTAWTSLAYSGGKISTTVVGKSEAYAAATTDVLLTKVTGDTQDRFIVNADGKLEWGPGNATQDTNLYRSAANVLKTDDSLEVTNQLVLGTTGATPGSVGLHSDGSSIYIGANTAAIYLRPTGVGTNNNMVVVDAGAAGGRLTFYSGAGSGDVLLYRSAADKLATNDGLVLNNGTLAGGSDAAVSFYAGSGAPNNANGANGDFYFRSDGGALTAIYQRRVGVWVGVV